MESLLFKYLKDKATNDDTKNKRVYFEKKSNGCTYEMLYEAVLKKIENFKELNWQNPYLLALNDLESISSLIALLAIGCSPIILNGVKLDHDLDDDYYNWLKGFSEEYHIINDYPRTAFNMQKLINDIDSTQNCEVINKPGQGMIGIFSSGTLSNPKIIYMDEKTLINKVFESNYVDDYRIIYNTAPFSTVSGLFTNIFVPIVSDYTSGIIFDQFDPLIATAATDVYLPRNFADSFKNNDPKENVRIKRIFTYGEQNSKALFDFVRKKIEGLPQNVFVNVYGTTECGGLVSEIEEKDMQELHIYFLDILNDTIIYSYDDQTIYKKVGKNITIIDKNQISQYNITKYLPCGFITNKIKIKDNNCIGECLVNDFNTGDIITIIDDKFYVIGRKRDIDKNYYLANYDNEISSQTDRICATFTDDDNNLCIAIRCSLEKEDNMFRDHTTYFRRLLTEAPKIRKLIQDRYPNIKKTIFITSYMFKLSSGIKKSNRNGLSKYLKYGEMINERIDHFDEELSKYLSRRFKGILGYIPNFQLSKDHNILVSKKEITLEQIVKLLNDLNILMVHEDSDYYELIYSDSYFFYELPLERLYFSEDDALYDENTIDYYKDCAKYNLLIPRLALDNSYPLLNTDYPDKELYESLTDTYIFCLKGTNKDGEIILIPYYLVAAKEKYQLNGKKDTKHEEERMENAKKVLEIIKDYKDYEFEEIELMAPIPDDKFNPLFDVIKVNDDNNRCNFTQQNIKNAYLLMVNSFIYNLRNIGLYDTEMTKILK